MTRVRPEDRAAIFRRDKQCVVALLDRSHAICRDRWGERHLPTELDKLTIEHVRTEPGGKRRDDEWHLVAMCAHANIVEHWGSTTENRRLLNAYLAGVRAAA